MIKVTYSLINEKMTLLEVEGHAYSGEPGKDLVCSAVSAITFGGLNALSQNQEIIQIKVNNSGHVIIKASEEISLKDHIILETMLTQLKTIAHSYPQNIKVTRKDNEENVI